jgi:hypothetical protein
MRLWKWSFGVLLPLTLLTLSSTQFTACKKTQIVHDTSTVIVVDTVLGHDSLSDITTGLVAYYNFNNGKLLDSSGHQNNIYFNTATPTADRLGRPNNAYYFDGDTSAMHVSNSPSLNQSEITLMAIVEFKSFTTGICLINQILMKGYQDQDSGVYGLRVYLGPGGCATQVDTTTEKLLGTFGNFGYTSYTVDSATFIHTNTWYTLVYTYDGTSSKIYINGRLESVMLQVANFAPNPYDLTIGQTENGEYPYPFNGIIDEIRIYNHALGPSAVLALSKVTE